MKKITSILLIAAFICAALVTLTSCETPCEHISYGPWNVVSKATCTSSGLREKTCTKCSHREEEIIPALGHNFVGGVCTDCGEFE